MEKDSTAKPGNGAPTLLPALGGHAFLCSFRHAWRDCGLQAQYLLPQWPVLPSVDYSSITLDAVRIEREQCRESDETKESEGTNAPVVMSM